MCRSIWPSDYRPLLWNIYKAVTAINTIYMYITPEPLLFPDYIAKTLGYYITI